MPLSPLHKQQKHKNFTLLAVLVGLAALILAITVIKLEATL